MLMLKQKYIYMEKKKWMNIIIYMQEIAKYLIDIYNNSRRQKNNGQTSIEMKKRT